MRAERVEVEIVTVMLELTRDDFTALKNRIHEQLRGKFSDEEVTDPLLLLAREVYHAVGGWY